MTQEYCKALKSGDWLEFFSLDQPRCPHCGEECGIGQNDLNRLYEEGEHEVDCPSCELPFTVSTRVKFSFSTDEQPDPIPSTGT